MIPRTARRRPPSRSRRPAEQSSAMRLLVCCSWLTSTLSNPSATPKKPARSRTSSPSRTTRFRRPCRRAISRVSPYNLVRVILGERKPEDSDTDNVYTRAAAHLNDWIASRRSGARRRARHLRLLPGIHRPRHRRAPGAQGLHRARRRGGVLRRHRPPARADPRRSQEGPHGAAPAHPRPLRARSSCCTPTRRAPSMRCSTRPPSPPPIAEVTDEYGAIHRIWKIARRRARSSNSWRTRSC